MLRGKRLRKQMNVVAALAGSAMALSVAVAPPVMAQDLSRDFPGTQGRIVAPVLLIDRERLFAESMFGKRISALLEAERRRQETRTKEIEAELKAEELALTEERASLTSEEFRARADAFDAKVEAMRTERDQAEQDLVAQIEQAQAQFLQQVSPVLAGILQEYGAQIMLEKRLALLAARQVDVTDEAIARIDDAMAQSDAPDAPAGGDEQLPADTAPEGVQPDPATPAGQETPPSTQSQSGE